MHNIDQKLLLFGLGLKNTNGIQWLEDFQNQLQEVEHNSRLNRVPERNPGLKHETHHFNLNSIKKSCGEVCHTNITGISSEPFDIIQKNIQCKALFENPILDAASQYDKPPKGNINWVPTYIYVTTSDTPSLPHLAYL